MAGTFKRAIKEFRRWFGKEEAFRDLLAAGTTLMDVSGALADRYRRLVKVVLGHDCGLERFTVDRGGYSPEVAKELGPDYLETGDSTRMVIILSPEQAAAPLISSNSSYEALILERIYAAGQDVIGFLTFKHLLWGVLEDGIGLLDTPDDLLLLETVALRLDTQERDLEKLELFHREALELLRGDGLNRDSTIHAMLHLRNELVKRLGNLGDLSFDGPVLLEAGIGSFHSEVFGGCYVLRDDESCLIYREDEAPPPRPLVMEEVPCFNMKSPELLDYLLGKGFIALDPGLIPQRLREMENELLLEQNLDPVRLNFIQRRHSLKQLRSLFPTEYFELRDLEKVSGERKNRHRLGELSARCTAATRLKLSVAKKQPAFINRLLADMDPTDVYRLYRYNTERFKDQFGQAPEERKIYYYETILDSITQPSQYNLEANAFLNRYSELNRKLRVRFRQAG